MPHGIEPICAECQQMIWPGDGGVAEIFTWYQGDPEDDPLDPALCRLAVTHQTCADRFAERIGTYL